MKEENKHVELSAIETENGNVATIEGAINVSDDNPESKIDEAYTIDHALTELGSACGMF